MMRHPSRRRQDATASEEKNGHENEIRVGRSAVLDSPKPELRFLILVPVVLQVLVFLSLPTVADVILRTLDGAPLSSDARQTLAIARIPLMLAASMSTMLVAVALGSATLRSLGRLKAAGSPDCGDPADMAPCASIAGERVAPLRPAADLQMGPSLTVASRSWTGGTIGPPASPLKLVIGHETARPPR